MKTAWGRKLLLIVLFIVALLGANIGGFAQPARAEGQLYQTFAPGRVVFDAVGEFSSPCVILNNAVVSDFNGGEVRLAATVEDYFSGTSVDSTRWISGNAYTWYTVPPSVSNGVLTLDSAYLRSQANMQPYPVRFFEARALQRVNSNNAGWPDLGFYRALPPLDPNAVTSDTAIRLFVTRDTNITYVRGRDGDGSSPLIDFDLPAFNLLQYHTFRIEWDTLESRFYVDGVQYAAIPGNSLLNTYVFLYNQTPSVGYNASVMQVDWVRAGAYPGTGSYTSCPIDASYSARWQTISTQNQLPSGTGMSLLTRTSADGISWSAWSDGTAGVINSPTGRYLQYQINMNTTNVLNSPEIQRVQIDFIDPLTAPTSTNTPLPTATATNTPLPTATNTPLPTSTNTPLPTATNTPLPTATNTPLPTSTNTPLPTATNTPLPTATNTPLPTATNTPLPTAMNTPLPTATNTPLPTATNTPLPTATATNTPVPTPVSNDRVYISSASNGTAGALSFADEDILYFDRATGLWTMLFDGSDVGLASTDIDAFDFMDDGSILLSFNSSTFTVPGLGTLEDRDVFRFIPTTLGGTTAGTFQWFIDGSDIGLGSSSEDIDAIEYTANGQLILSFVDNFTVAGVSGLDEDLVVFTPTTLGATTSGTWGMYFDGSDVGLSQSASEDVDGLWIDPQNGSLYLSTLGTFSVTGAAGDGADIFICQPITLGANTACTYGPGLYWDGSLNNFPSVVDAFAITR